MDQNIYNNKKNEWKSKSAVGREKRENKEKKEKRKKIRKKNWKAVNLSEPNLAGGWSPFKVSLGNKILEFYWLTLDFWVLKWFLSFNGEI